MIREFEAKIFSRRFGRLSRFKKNHFNHFNLWQKKLVIIREFVAEKVSRRLKEIKQIF